MCKREYDRLVFKTNPKNYTSEAKLKRIIRYSVRRFFRYKLDARKTQTCKKYGIEFDFIYEQVGPSPGESFQLDHIIPLALFDYTKGKIQ